MNWSYFEFTRLLISMQASAFIVFAACLGFPSNIFSVIFSTSCLVIICFNPYTDLFYICIENKNLPELSSIKSGILIVALAGSRWFAEGVNFSYSRYKKSGFHTVIISSRFQIFSAKTFAIRLYLLLSSIIYYCQLIIFWAFVCLFVFVYVLLIRFTLLAYLFSVWGLKEASSSCESCFWWPDNSRTQPM